MNLDKITLERNNFQDKELPSKDIWKYIFSSAPRF